MKITQVEFEILNVILDRPYRVAYGEFDREFSHVVRLTNDQGYWGIGQGTPCVETDDTPEQVLAEVANLKSADLPETDSTDEFYDRYVSRFSSATLRCALDLAFHDLLARSRGIPVYQLWSPTPREVPNTFTIFLQDTPAESAREAARVRQLFPDLTALKIKLCGQDDLARCQAILKEMPPGLTYVLDANQGYPDPAVAVRSLREIISLLGKVLIIEEPTEKYALAKLSQVSEQLPQTTVMADESCHNPAELERIIEAQACRGINIKLQKAGGLTPGRRMAERAAACQMTAMIGCMVELPIALSAGVHLAAAMPNVILTDLDTDYMLPELCEHEIPFKQGMRRPQPGPGLGCTIRYDEVSRLVKSGKIEHRKVPLG